jgi:tRNA uridine 5-carboxymethylaminomethyl modification enzyme
MDKYDVVVIGAGHAGCEAAHATAKMGLNTCLITTHLETIAQMSCNPAIGGLAKGHLVREIDALGGLMGLVADETGIQFRLLNRSRGGAVQSPRAQSDKALYRLVMKKKLEDTQNLTLFQGIVSEILIKGENVYGVRTLGGNTIQSQAVILTPGTFLNGVIHIGLQHYSAGRANEPASLQLAEDLKDKGFKIIRLKTGTPMRLHMDSIDWTCFKEQPGDQNPVPFSFRTRKKLENKIVCYLGRTNQDTHDVIEKNLNRSPLYSGKITGIGPRYCPSIEDKVVKFRHHKTHQFYLEPEGLETKEIYVNGLSSSLPYDVQRNILSTIPGLDQARILRPAYGIEYDALAPTQLNPTLETQAVKNLYFAGQINGTSGYEEAAAQGLMAAINAAQKIKKKDPFVLKRNEAYIGVLIDDLVSKGVEEPYRLFTSRAEYRLHLRIDNADKRLTEYGYLLGLINEDEFSSYKNKQERTQNALSFFQNHKIRIHNKEVLIKDFLRKPHVRMNNVLEYAKLDIPLSEEEMQHIESEVKYEGYLKKQEKEVQRIQKHDQEKIPRRLDFKKIPGLTREIIEKLETRHPGTIGEAKAIPGVTPAAIINIQIHLKLQKKKKKG